MDGPQISVSFGYRNNTQLKEVGVLIATKIGEVLGTKPGKVVSTFKRVSKEGTLVIQIRLHQGTFATMDRDALAAVLKESLPKYEIAVDLVENL